MLKKLLGIVILTFAISMSAYAQLPAVSLKDIEGKTINTAKLPDGKNPIIISFFATWCKPCLRELTAINEVYDDWQEETGVRLVAVSIDAGSNSFKVKPLVKSKDWSYEVLLDVNSDFKRAMNVSAVPAVFVLSPQGKIIYRHTGYTMGSEEAIIEAIRNYQDKD